MAGHVISSAVSSPHDQRAHGLPQDLTRSNEWSADPPAATGAILHQQADKNLLDDILLAGSILDAMSHQATFLGRAKEAANLARAARTGTRGYATATLTAH